MPEIQQEWMKLVQLSKSVIERRFSCLMYSRQQVWTLDEVPATAIKEALLSLWPDLDLNKLMGKDLAVNKDLEMFFKTHCRVWNYTFQIKKCGLSPCPQGVCNPPCLQDQKFKALHWLPNPHKDAHQPGHFLPYQKIKGQDTIEDQCPSLLSRAEKKSSTRPPGMFTAQCLRDTIVCQECNKPWGLYSQKCLMRDDEEALVVLKDSVLFTCGSPLTTEGSPLHDKVFTS